MEPQVCILLSSFNGAEYLAEQLDSLVNQTYPNIAISVRDDGSVDNTREILEEYTKKYPRIRVEYGQNIGISRSFLMLLSQADRHCQYFAFCDQDDVWCLDKIQRAVPRLASITPDRAALYCSRLEYVGRDLTHLKNSRLLRRELLFQNALVENVATGCTVVMNRSARDQVVSRLPEQCIMHDWWCYLVVSAFGEVVYDDRPTIKYRLHDENDTGAALSFMGDMGRRVSRFARRGCSAFRIHSQAIEFKRIHGCHLRADKRATLDRFIDSRRSIVRRLRFAFDPGLYRQSTMDNVFFRMLLVLGWY